MDNSMNFDAIFGMLTGIIITLGMFATIFFSIFYALKAKNKERLAIIEKGIDVSSIYRKRENKHVFFKFGFILIGLAIGLIFGSLFQKIGLLPPVVSYFAMILLFGGGTILLANYLVAKKEA